jgi:hypothetical protein
MNRESPATPCERLAGESQLSTRKGRFCPHTQPLPYRHRGVRGERDSRKLDLVTLKFDELIAMIE